MKLYKIILVFVGMVSITGCIKNPNQIQTEFNTNLDNIESLAKYHVTTKTNSTTIVTYLGETLAVTTEPIDIWLPKEAVSSTKAGEDSDLVITFSDAYDKIASSSYWQFVAFEDTENGDLDYNDLVIHAKVTNSVNHKNSIYAPGYTTTYIYVQGVALGAFLNITLGISYKENGIIKDAILSDNCRRDFFNHNGAFPINTRDYTEPNRTHYPTLHPMTPLVLNQSVALKVMWFIEADHIRYYAATNDINTDIANVIGHNGLPYGISFTKKFDYPIEKDSITAAYPNFKEWVKDGNTNDFFKNKNSDYTYKVRYNDIDLWDYK
ncbi:MAG: DUF4842 domain-containing protein [Bacteroidales bacterium]